MMTKNSGIFSPTIGSIWKAQDGRILLVESVTSSPSEKSGGKANLRVLAPLARRQRTETKMGLNVFGTFLKMISFEELVKHDPDIGSYDAMVFPFCFRFLKGLDQKGMTDRAREFLIDLRFHASGSPEKNTYFGNEELLDHVRKNDLPEWKDGGMKCVGAWLSEDNEVTSIYAKDLSEPDTDFAPRGLPPSSAQSEQPPIPLKVIIHRPLEKCWFCHDPTNTWSVAPEAPCCRPCAASHSPDQLPPPSHPQSGE